MSGRRPNVTPAGDGESAAMQGVGTEVQRRQRAEAAVPLVDVYERWRRSRASASPRTSAAGVATVSIRTFTIRSRRPRPRSAGSFRT